VIEGEAEDPQNKLKTACAGLLRQPGVYVTLIARIGQQCGGGLGPAPPQGGLTPAQLLLLPLCSHARQH